MTKEQVHEFGYCPAREVPNEGWCGLRTMFATTGLFCQIDETGYRRRYCYADFYEALEALGAWTGEGDPPGPWIKEKPSDRCGPGYVEVERATMVMTLREVR
jgi:hypothetical protein